jgi:hypothetical protein
VTIRTDLDAAIAEHFTGSYAPKGHGLRLRMGVGSRAALVADRGTDGLVYLTEDGLGDEPLWYRGIPIDPVDPPSQNVPATDDRFHGWQIVTD